MEWVRSKLSQPKPKFQVIVHEINFYKSQLRFPEKNSDYVSLFSTELQNSLSRFDVISKMNDADLIAWLKQFDTDGEDFEESSEVVAHEEEEFKVSYIFVSRCLYNIFDIMKEISFQIMREMPRIQIFLERARKMDLPID